MRSGRSCRKPRNYSTAIGLWSTACTRPRGPCETAVDWATGPSSAETNRKMKATFGLIALFGPPAAGAALSHPEFHEPTLLMLSGILLLGIGALLRKHS